MSKGSNSTRSGSNTTTRAGRVTAIKRMSSTAKDYAVFQINTVTRDELGVYASELATESMKRASKILNKEDFRSLTEIAKEALDVSAKLKEARKQLFDKEESISKTQSREREQELKAEKKKIQETYDKEERKVSAWRKSMLNHLE